VLDARSVGAYRLGDASRERVRVTACVDEHDVGAGVVSDGLEVREVRNHERILWRRRELLHDANDVEGRNAETTVRTVEHAQAEEIVEVERVVGDRLAGDEDAVPRRAQTIEDVGGTAAEKVRVAQARTVPQSGGVDPEGVLQVGPDVGVRVIDGG